MLLLVNLPLPCFLVFPFLLLVSLLLRQYHHSCLHQPVRVSSILHWHIPARAQVSFTGIFETFQVSFTGVFETSILFVALLH